MSDNEIPKPYSVLTFACKTCDIAKVEQLLTHDHDVNEVDAAKQSPLLCAVEGGHVSDKKAQMQVIRLLTHHKAILDSASRDGRTPIWCACRWGLSDVVACLMAAKADPTQTAKYGESAIDVAIRYKRVSLLQRIEELLSKEAMDQLKPFLRQYSRAELRRMASDAVRL